MMATLSLRNELIGLLLLLVCIGAHCKLEHLKLKSLGRLNFYPKAISLSESKHAVKLKISLGKDRNVIAEEMKDMYKEYSEKCVSLFNTTSEIDDKRCSPSDDFGSASDYFCFFLRLENVQQWEPRGFVKTNFLPSYNESFIPVSCTLTTGYQFNPEKNYETRVKLWPSLGFPRKFYPTNQHLNGCSPIITGIIDDPEFRNQYYELRRLKCRVWDLANLDKDRLVVDFNAKRLRDSHSQNTSTRKTSQSTAAFQTLPARTLEDSVSNIVDSQPSLKDEYFERRDPSAGIEDQYADLKMEVADSK